RRVPRLRERERPVGFDAVVETFLRRRLGRRGVLDRRQVLVHTRRRDQAGHGRVDSAGGGAFGVGRPVEDFDCPSGRRDAGEQQHDQQPCEADSVQSVHWMSPPGAMTKHIQLRPREGGRQRSTRLSCSEGLASKYSLMASSPASTTVPRRLSADERRAQILREAARLCGSHAFNGPTTRDVATRVGITEAALYRYFPSKEAMYTAILDERMAAPDLLAPIERLAESDDDRAVFSALALTLLRSVEADPSILRLVLYSPLEGHQMARPFQEGRIRRLREFLQRHLERRIREGAFRAVDPALRARAFIGMVVDHLIVREVFGQRDQYPQSAEAVAETYVSIFLDGMRKHG